MATFTVGGDWVFTNKFEIGTALLDSGGAVGTYLSLQSLTTAPTLPISAGHGMIAVNSTGSLLFANSSGSVNLSQLAQTAWRTDASNTGAGLRLGTLTSASFDIFGSVNTLISFEPGIFTLSILSTILNISTSTTCDIWTLGRYGTQQSNIFGTNLNISASGLMSINTISSSPISISASGTLFLEGSTVYLGASGFGTMQIGNSGTNPLTISPAVLKLQPVYQIEIDTPSFVIKNLTEQNAGGTYKSLIIQTQTFAGDANEIFYGDGVNGAPWDTVGNYANFMSLRLGTLDNAYWEIICAGAVYLALDPFSGTLSLNAIQMIKIAEQTSAVEYGSSTFSTNHSFMGNSFKIIYPTTPGANNTPLLIDIDGTVHF